MHNRPILSSLLTPRRLSVVPLAGALALAAALVSAGQASASPVALPANCTQSGLAVTCSYGYTGAEQTFTVPSGITSVQVTAIGAVGGNGFLETPTGEGGLASAALPVTPGATLYAEVGGVGQDVTGANAAGGAGGFNGGGYGAASDIGSIGQPGGGGASDVRTVSGGSDPATTGLGSRLIVAGGGGGNGLEDPGGAAGQPGSGGVAGGGPGGGAGTATGGGAAGAPPAAAGVLGQGGAGGLAQPLGSDRSERGGAGGGGGYYGGGGGGLGAGGGGGSSFVPAGGTTGLSGAPASVTISYSVVTPLSITTTSLPGGVVGTAYSQALAATGGTAPYTWSVTGLPAGLSVSPSGVISGTPEEAGTSSFAVNVTDSTSPTPMTAAANFSVAVTATTATALSSSANPSLAGQQVTFTATVSPAPDGGTIAFDDGTAAITGCGAVPVSTSTGTATCQTSALPAGTGQVTAVYGGDASYQGSTSTALTQVVQADTPQALATLTLQYVQGSAKFQQLSPAQQKLVVQLADLQIAQLAKISPNLTPHQLAALVAAYKQGVAVLQAQGWVTAAQASTLDSLASTVQP